MTASFTDTAATLAFAVIAIGSSLSLAAPQQTQDAAAAQTRIEIRIENHKVVGDKVIRLTEGQRVELIWTTDAATELHIHGYDIRIDVSPEVPAKISFIAHATGRFAVTSHGFGDQNGHGHETLAYIEVYPK